jgi:hypothetical protein
VLLPYGSCSCTRHDTNPPWYKLKASCCKEGIPKRFYNDDTTVWIFLRCKTQTWKFMCGRLPGKRIVCSASKVTTCSSVYQTCQVVVNSMLHQQGDNTLIMYQSCHATATVKQDDSHYIVFSASKVTTCSSVNRTCQVVANSMLRQQGDNTLIKYQSCHAIAKQVDSQYKWLTLLQFYLRIWLSPSWILPSAAKAFPASVTKKIAMPRKMRWQSLSHLPSL